MFIYDSMSFTEDGKVHAEVQMGKQGVERLRKRIGDLNLDCMLPMDMTHPKLTIFKGCKDDVILRSKVGAAGKHVLF